MPDRQQLTELQTAVLRLLWEHGELTERLFAGDVTALVSHLLSARDMTPGDLARVRKMIQGIRPKTGESA